MVNADELQDHGYLGLKVGMIWEKKDLVYKPFAVGLLRPG